MAPRVESAKKRMTYMEGENVALILSSWIFITIDAFIFIYEICKPFLGWGERNYFLMLVCMAALVWYLILWARHSQILDEKNLEIRQLRAELTQIRIDHNLGEGLIDPDPNDGEDETGFTFSQKDQWFLKRFGFFDTPSN